MLKSLKSNRKGIILMIGSSFLVCCGQLFWKLANNGSVFYLLVGFCLYGLGALIMLIAYKYGKLSVLQPMLSTNYVFTLFFGYFILRESLSVMKVFAVVMIMTGVFLIGGSDDE